MNSVGIDVSKGKSMIAVMRPFGEVVVTPFEIHHTESDLEELATLLKSLPGETRVVMEATGNYHLPIAWLLNVILIRYLMKRWLSLLVISQRRLKTSLNIQARLRLILFVRTELLTLQSKISDFSLFRP